MSVFDKYTEAREGMVGKAKRFIADFFPYILVLMNIALMTVSNLFEIGFKNPFSEEFLVSLVLNITTQTLSYGSFVAYGETQTKLTLKSYNDNLNVWGEISSRIRTGALFEKLIVYCKEQVEKEREEKRISYIINHTRLSLERYEAEYKDLTPKELMDQVKHGDITLSERFYILKARGRIKVKPINPLILLCGSKRDNFNDAGRVEGGSAVKSIALRPFMMLFTSSVVAGMSCVYSGVSDGSAWFSMLCSAFLIVVSAFLGYSKGVENAKKTNDAIKIRILFLERFEKRAPAE